MNNINNVSVVICAYTEERLSDIREAVQSVTNQSYSPYEVILSIDHNNNLADLLSKEFSSQIKIVRNDGIKGLSETRNVGVRAADRDIIAFLDDDAVADKDWLKYLSAPFKDDAVVAAGGKAVPLWLGGSRPGWFPDDLDWVIGCTHSGLVVKDKKVRNVIGCNMAFRKLVFDIAGYFNSKVGRTGKTTGVGEEAELCLNITHKIAGSLIVYQPLAVIHHKVPSWRLTPGYLWQRSYNEGYFKTKVERYVKSFSNSPLNMENSYLKYLLLNSIPKKLSKFYHGSNLAQAAAITFSILGTGSGYLVGKIKNS